MVDGKGYGLVSTGNRTLVPHMNITYSYGEENAAKWRDCSTVKQELFLFEVKINNPKHIHLKLIF
jgi:hypothetical protein